MSDQPRPAQAMSDQPSLVHVMALQRSLKAAQDSAGYREAAQAMAAQAIPMAAQGCFAKLKAVYRLRPCKVLGIGIWYFRQKIIALNLPKEG